MPSEPRPLTEEEIENPTRFSGDTGAFTDCALATIREKDRQIAALVEALAKEHKWGEEIYALHGEGYDHEAGGSNECVSCAALAAARGGKP